MNERNDVKARSDAPTRRQAIVGVAIAVGGLAMGATKALAGRGEEVSKNEEAIHQETVFKASRKRVYEALTDTRQFDKVVQLSAAFQSGKPPGATATVISGEAGGAFSAFGGHISGRQIELVPNERIVQAWRASNWDAGEYSIAKFTLVEQGAETKIVLHHAGIPKGQGEHLAAGWKANYWEPLAKFLA